MKEVIKKALPLLGALIFLGALLGNAAVAAEACREALGMCGRLLIPALFPFFVLSGVLSRLGLPGMLGRILAPAAVRIYRISGAGASALPMGLLGGYPAGAAYIAEMEKTGAVTRAEGERLLAFCSNSGPAFLVGAMGVGVFGSVKLGLLLYFSHVLAALLTGLFFRSGSGCAEIPDARLESVDPAAALTDSVRQAVAAILSVCGFAVCFSVLLAVLDGRSWLSLSCVWIAARTGFEPSFVRAMLTGFFELGSGTACLQGLRTCPETLALAAFLAGWGGLSVWFQTLSVLEGSRLKASLYLTGRLLCAGIAAGIAYVGGMGVM